MSIPSPPPPSGGQLLILRDMHPTIIVFVVGDLYVLAAALLCRLSRVGHVGVVAAAMRLHAAISCYFCVTLCD